MFLIAYFFGFFSRSSSIDLKILSLKLPSLIENTSQFFPKTRKEWHSKKNCTYMRPKHQVQNRLKPNKKLYPDRANFYFSKNFFPIQCIFLHFLAQKRENIEFLNLQPNSENQPLQCIFISKKTSVSQPPPPFHVSSTSLEGSIRVYLIFW